MEGRDGGASTEPLLHPQQPLQSSLQRLPRLFQDPSSSQADNSSELPLLDLSSLLQQRDMSIPLPAKASADSHQLYSQGISSSDSLSSEYYYEKAHPQIELLPSEVPADVLCQNPSEKAGSHESSASDEDSQLPPSTSISHANPLEQLPVTMSTHRPPYEASTEEDFHSTSEQKEVPDDVKREMLKERCKGVAILSCKSEATGGPCYVYLIGTAHVSEESCREVRAAISLMEPEVVFVELCEKRSFILQRTHFSVPTVSDMLTTFKEQRSNVLGILYSWFLAKVATKLNVFPGSEFRAAYEEATACGAKVILGDRDIQVTLRRTWGKMSTWHKTKFITTMVFNAFCLPKADQLNELIEKLQDADMLTLAFEELGKSFPTVMETLIDERDMFMAAVLQKLGEDNSSIVAVVGRGHVAGISKHWGQDIPIHNLMEIPQKKSIWNASYVLSALVALTSIILFVYYYRSGS